MKRSDEMKLGEKLRGYCDCNQGRSPCTCKDPMAQLYAASARTERRFVGDQYELALRLMSLGPENVKVDPYSIKINDEPLLPPPTTEYPTDRRKDPIGRFSMAAQLQLMKALAILGWAAFILELLRV